MSSDLLVRALVFAGRRSATVRRWVIRRGWDELHQKRGAS